MDEVLNCEQQGSKVSISSQLLFFLLLTFYLCPTAGFIKSPLSEVRLTGESVELHCEAIGRPIPEIQWWFEADYNNESFSQLWDGAREDRVQMNTTYVFHATSTLYLFDLSQEDSGTYECRASNDPDRNHLTKIPRIKWIRSQANVVVIDRE